MSKVNKDERIIVFTVFPRMMSLVAKQRVMRAGLVQELALKHKALTSARKLVERKTADEGF